MVFVNNDPFNNKKEYEMLLDKVRDEHFWDTLDLSKAYFEKIVLGFCLPSVLTWQYKFDIVLDEQAIYRIQERRKRKLEMLEEIEQRKANANTKHDSLYHES